jgi:hypothetical protein
LLSFVPLGSFLVQRNAGSQDRWIAEERLDIGCWFDFLENKYLINGIKHT